MARIKILVLCLVLVQLACSTLTNAFSNPSGSAGGPTTEEADSEAKTTLEPFEFTPDYFGKVTLMHDYWPAIARAANLDPAIPLATVLTVWNYSPDGRYVAAAGCDKVRGSGDRYFDWYTCEQTIDGGTSHPFLFILDAHTEEIVATLPVSEEVGSVTGLDFSHDGSLLAYGITSYFSTDGLLMLWDIAAGEVKAELSETSYYGGVFSPDDSLIAFTEHGTIKIWDVQKQETIQELQAELDSGASAVFSADGTLMLLDSFPADALYDVATWKKLSSRHDLGIGALQTGDYSPDLIEDAECEYQVEDEPVMIFEVATNEILQTLDGEWGECGWLGYSVDGKVLYRTDITGRELFAWTTADWQMYDESDTLSDKITPEDKYLVFPRFSLDGRTVMLKTFTRLLLFGIP